MSSADADRDSTYSPSRALAPLFSSATAEWATPRAFFAKLDRRFHFTLDPCATPDNATCPTFFTKDDDGLTQDWGTHRVFCNPPYGREIGKWVRKCFEASQRGALVVLLVPARTDTKWFHDWVRRKARVEFIPRRLRFGNAKKNAPFPSLLAIYSPNRPAMTCARCGRAFVGRRNAQTCSNACRQWLYRNRKSLRFKRNAKLPAQCLEGRAVMMSESAHSEPSAVK
jgi:phage N-6-adenine-methyltransferase